MFISRRDFLKYCVAMAGALGLEATGLTKLQQVLASENQPPVVWLQGQGCSGCSVSLLNTIHYMTIDDLLINTLDLEFHPTVRSLPKPSVPAFTLTPNAGNMAAGC